MTVMTAGSVDEANGSCSASARMTGAGPLRSGACGRTGRGPLAAAGVHRHVAPVAAWSRAAPAGPAAAARRHRARATAAMAARTSSASAGCGHVQFCVRGEVDRHGASAVTVTPATLARG